MTDVTIEIINYRYDVSDGEPETISYRAEGTCRASRDGLKLEYTEPDVTGMDGTVTTVTAFKNGVVSVNRVGKINTHMVFEEGKLHSCIYNTGYFPMQLSILTTRMENGLTAVGGCLDLEYSMEVGGMHASKNRMRYVVTPCGVVS
jgi:uncharacterized beta-barrel protein YwiB (DUF1934 family)